MNGLKKLPLIIKPLFWNSNTNDSSPQCIKYSLNGILKVWFLSSCEKKELPNSPLCLWKYWDIGGEPPPMKDQQGKYSNESRTETGKQSPDFLKQAWKLLYKPLTGCEGNYINVSLQRAYKANTGLFDDFRGFKGDSDLDRLHVLHVLELSELISCMKADSESHWKGYHFKCDP